MKKKVLILGVASAQMDAIIELKNMGCCVFACAMADDGPGSKYADHFETLDFTNTKALFEYMKREKFDCIYSVGSDLAMPILSSMSEKLNLPHFISSESAFICNNKDKMRSFLGKNFEWNIRYQVLRYANEIKNIAFPFIMKPSDSQGQRGVKFVETEDQFQTEFKKTKAYSRSGNVILEEYLDGKELSVNTYIVDGEIVFCVVSDRVIWPQYDGGLIHKHIVPAQEFSTELESEIHRLVIAVSGKLNILNGPLYLQIKLKNKKPKIIEITPRLDGCHMWNILHYYTGINLLNITFEHLLFGNTNVIKNQKPFDGEYVLEFLCQKTNTMADYSKFNIPEDSLYSFYYYSNGDNVRSVNGRFEKIGYFIIKSNEKRV